MEIRKCLKCDNNAITIFITNPNRLKDFFSVHTEINYCSMECFNKSKNNSTSYVHTRGHDLLSKATLKVNGK